MGFCVSVFLDVFGWKWCFLFEFVEVGNQVVLVLWFVCDVGVVVMQDQLVMCILVEFWCYEFDEFVFDFVYIFVWCNVGVVGDLEDVCIYCDGGMVEGCVEDYVGGFVVDIW